MFESAPLRTSASWANKLAAMTRKRLLDVAYMLQKSMWRLARPRTRGVKVMLFNADGELALIRNSYGHSDIFVLPGGGIGLFEQPAVAARREIREELGVETEELVLRSRHSSTAEGKRDEIHLFEARVRGTLNIDRVEIAEARFASLADLPQSTSPATRRRIDEFLGLREADGSW